MAETAAAVKDRPAKAKPATVERADSSAEELLAHLRETGTPAERTRMIERWLEENDPQTAQALYDWMEEQNVTYGTLVKAGRWIHGSGFEVASAVQQTPGDELLRVRRECDSLRDSNQTLASEKLGLAHQNNYLREQIEELTRKVRYLSIGKSQRELADIGVKSEAGASPAQP